MQPGTCMLRIRFLNLTLRETYSFSVRSTELITRSEYGRKRPFRFAVVAEHPIPPRLGKIFLGQGLFCVYEGG